jgi:hypothetical protein
MKQKTNCPTIKTFLDGLIRHLQVVEFSSVFLPLVLIVIDIAAGSLTNINLIDYKFFGSYLSVYGCLFLIVLFAVLLSSIKDRALGKDNSLTVYGLNLPRNTTTLIQNAYSLKSANNESVQAIVTFVFLQLIAMFLYGVLLAIFIFKSYLWRYINA